MDETNEAKDEGLPPKAYLIDISDLPEDKLPVRIEYLNPANNPRNRKGGGAVYVQRAR